MPHKREAQMVCNLQWKGTSEVSRLDETRLTNFTVGARNLDLTHSQSS